MPADPCFEIDLGRVLQAIETASPSSAVQVLAAQLGQQFGAEQVSFLIADFSGHSLVRITQSRSERPRQEVAQVPVQLGGDSPYARAMTGQRVQVEPEGDGARLLVPVTARGEAIGLLELVLPDAPSDDMTGALAVAGHAMAYVVTSERRHTDLYEWGQRSRPLTLAAEIQHRLMPDAFTCEDGVFTLAAWLEPASDIGGDTFDYSVDPDRLFLSMTDAMGHETDSALLATLTVNSLRNSRRGGADLPQMADVAAAVILEHSDGFGFVTGQLMSVELATGAATMINAGHPLPLLDRAGEVRQLDLHADVPFGIQFEGYRLQHFAFQPGDRLLFVTDGMLESNAGGVDLPSLLAALRARHPRQVVHSLTDHVLDASRGDLRDDATVLCLDWSGSRSGERDSSAGADVGEHPAAP